MHLHCASFQTVREPGSFVTLLSNLEPKVKLPVPPAPGHASPHLSSLSPLLPGFCKFNSQESGF